MRTLYMETTKKEPWDTISEISGLLRAFSVQDTLMNYDDQGNIVAFSFTLKTEDNLIPYRLPVNHLPLWDMAQRGETKYIRDEQQARRVAWRQILRWLEAQLALVEIKMVSADQVLLPYMMINSKQTVYDTYVAGGIRPALPEGSTT